MKINESMFPESLVEAAAILSNAIECCTNHLDGRVNSIQDEETIIQFLESKYGDAVERPEPRDWWDVRLFGYPLQIKSSDFSKKSSDNFSSKAAILYALTYLPEEKVNVQKWSDFENALLNYTDVENGRDYYILIFDKQSKKVFLNSLKSLNKLTHNGSNLPFQIKWVDNIVPVSRSHKEAYNLIVGAYKRSVMAKINAHPFVEAL
jgi:hypothetical protein